MGANGGMEADGGCTCGAVRYRMSAPPMFVHCCHCRWCQRESGSAFVLNALIEADRVALLRGSPELVQTPSASGLGQKISRCAACRVALWSNYAGSGDAIRFLRVGTLDAPERFPPDIHIFTLSRLPWLELSAKAPMVPEYYELERYWPAESLARRRAAIAASG